MSCPHCAAHVDLTAERCERCGGALPRLVVSTLPPARRAPESERRQACIVFCDLGGYTRWNEEEDPEEVAFVMDMIRTEATRIFEAHGGIVNQFVGDEVMALFGIASSHEDDPCRALAAALAFHAFLRSDKLFGGKSRNPLRLHSGAEAGLIFARTHDLRSGIYEVTGEAVNTAARMRAVAGPDELVCGPGMRPLVEPFYRLVSLPAVPLYQSGQPVVPSRVLEPTDSNSWFEVSALRGLTRYVNRESELHELGDAWKAAQEGHGALVSISGQPGIGKTRFLHEFRTRVEATALVMHGRCSAYRNVAPYQPFIDALRGLLAMEQQAEPPALEQLTTLADRCALSPTASKSLSYLLFPGSEPSERVASLQSAELRTAIVAAIEALIVALSSERPVLLILEDWHWADEASRNALRLIGPCTRERRILIAVNYRSTELTDTAQPDAKLRIDLQPLDSVHTESMARSVMGGGNLPAGLSGFVHSRTLGNPFFVEEICRSLVESGTCRAGSDSVVLIEPLFQLRAPNTVQAIVRARVDRLPEVHRVVLRLASVIGAQFDLELLEVLANGASEPPLDASGPILAEMLDELEAQDMLHRDPTRPSAFQFKHAITREVAYETLPVRARRVYHARLAREIEARTPVASLETQYEALANHYRLGADRENAIRFAVLAGDKAWRSFALEQAGLQYRHALQEMAGHEGATPEATRRHIDVSLSWAKVGIYNPHVDQVRALTASLNHAREIGDLRRASLCLNWLSWIEYGLGDHRPSLEHARQFLSEATALNEARYIAPALLNLGRCQMVACEYDQAIDTLERGLEMRARADGAARSFGLSNLAMVLADRGDFERAFARIEESERVAHGQLSLLGPLFVLRSMVESWQGEAEASYATARRAADVALRIEGTYIRGMSAVMSGYARFMTTLDVAALEDLRDGIQQLETRGVCLHMSCSWSFLASALVLAGEYDQAENAAERALARVGDLDRQGETEAHRTLALVEALRDRQYARAMHRIQHVQGLARQKVSERDLALCDFTLAQLHRLQGEHADGAAALQRARSRADRIGMRLPSVLARAVSVHAQ